MKWWYIPVGVAAWEGAWWLRRRLRRAEVYQEAQERALALGKPLIVIGAPDGGITSGYGCGSGVVDLAKSSCPVSYQLDVIKTLPFADDSVVVFVSCVLEYVSDVGAALKEIQRISGGNAFFVGVEPWTPRPTCTQAPSGHSHQPTVSNYALFATPSRKVPRRSIVAVWRITSRP